MKITRRRFWTDDEIAMLREVYADCSTAQTAAHLGRTVKSIYNMARILGIKKSDEYLASPEACRLRRGDEIGKQFRFQKGHVPANKGLRRPGWAPGRMANTQFKKGCLSGIARAKYRQIGAERISKDGYLERKTTDEGATNRDRQRRWVAVHCLVWEDAHGSIPRGHIVVFRIGCRTINAESITADKLECITRSENMRRNTLHRYPQEIKDAIRQIGVLNRRIHDAEKHNRLA